MHPPQRDITVEAPADHLLAAAVQTTASDRNPMSCGKPPPVVQVACRSGHVPWRQSQRAKAVARGRRRGGWSVRRPT